MRMSIKILKEVSITPSKSRLSKKQRKRRRTIKVEFKVIALLFKYIRQTASRKTNYTAEVQTPNNRKQLAEINILFGFILKHRIF